MAENSVVDDDCLVPYFEDGFCTEMSNLDGLFTGRFEKDEDAFYGYLLSKYGDDLGGDLFHFREKWRKAVDTYPGHFSLEGITIILDKAEAAKLEKGQWAVGVDPDTCKVYTVKNDKGYKVMKDINIHAVYITPKIAAAAECLRDGIVGVYKYSSIENLLPPDLSGTKEKNMEANDGKIQDDKSLPLAPWENAEDMPLNELRDMSSKGEFDICDLVLAVNNENESLKSLDAYQMDYLDDVLEGKSKLEVLEMAFGGSNFGFEPTHELFRVDENNNLESFETSKDYRLFLESNIWKIVAEAGKVPVSKLPEDYVKCHDKVFKNSLNRDLDLVVVKETKARTRHGRKI